MKCISSVPLLLFCLTITGCGASMQEGIGIYSHRPDPRSPFVTTAGGRIPVDVVVFNHDPRHDYYVDVLASLQDTSGRVMNEHRSGVKEVEHRLHRRKECRRQRSMFWWGAYMEGGEKHQRFRFSLRVPPNCRSGSYLLFLTARDIRWDRIVSRSVVPVHISAGS
ncbi:MAG: hypothetical protein DRO99_04360 [Candidatus Aenigmatarchaeota archaeon]|nr:MAG: hypothetical protein DRO99_04360 [Candidatus Aenigmarchaeota archaeon]